VSSRLPEAAPGRGPNDGLLDTVIAMRDEIAGLRAAARTRAVIEQAKGVLVAREQITLDEAFNRLRRMSQEHNVRLIEVAATVVGVAVPEVDPRLVDLREDVVTGHLPESPSASRSWTALRSQRDVQVGVLTALIDSVAGGTTDGDEAAKLLCDLLAPQGVAALTLYRGAADESLRLVGQSGVPGDLISAWRSIPPSRDIPYIVSYTDNRSFFWGDRAARTRDFPSVAATKSAFTATATVPILDGGQVIGVVGLMWLEDQEFDPGRTEAIAMTVQRVAPLLLRSATAADPELEWMNTLLRLHLDPWLLLETVSSADGIVRDLVVQDAALQLSAGREWLGRRLLELWPFLAEEGIAQSLAGLARSGGAWTTTVATPSAAPWGIPGTRIRAVRLGRRIVLVWRPGRTADRRGT
jgi:hypothetical protein